MTGGARPCVAIGPELPGIGSWEWLGVDLVHQLHGPFEVRVFRDEMPACDVAVIVKSPPAPEFVAQAARQAAVVYLPVDAYGSSAEIDADYGLLSCCRRIVIHCERLRKYFQSYAPVEYLDHPLKYVTPLVEAPRPEGPLVWIGLRSNLPPVVEWVNGRRLPGPLEVLTNLDGAESVSAEVFGFAPRNDVTVRHWTAARHRALVGRARAALDVKGDGFRPRHKPPAKALDFLASGVPLAMNVDSSPAEHLAALGFAVASLDDDERWLSQEYWEETRRFGALLRDRLSREQVGRRFTRLLEAVLAKGGRG